MRRIRITLPAPAADIGSGLHGLALALGLYITVEITERTDTELTVETTGEGAGLYAVGLRHPVVLGMIRVFQAIESAIAGITIRIDSQIPVHSGLNVDAMFFVAGMLGANNLLNNPLSRRDLIQLAHQKGFRLDHLVATLIGGLSSSLFVDDDALIYRQLPLKIPNVVLVSPENIEIDVETVQPEMIRREDALTNLNRLPLLLEAFQVGDIKLLGRTLEDAISTPLLARLVPAFELLRLASAELGIQAMTFCGEGGAILLFGEISNTRLAQAVKRYLAEQQIDSLVYPLSIDTQGVVISIAQSS